MSFLQVLSVDCRKLINSCELFARWNIMNSWTSETEVFMMDYLSAKEIAEKWNISRRRVQILCEEGRIPGAFKLSDVWVIPKDAEKPADRRKAKKKIVGE